MKNRTLIIACLIMISFVGISLREQADSTVILKKPLGDATEEVSVYNLAPIRNKRLQPFVIGEAFPRKYKGFSAQLMEIAFKVKDPKEFPTILHQITKEYANDKNEYLRIMMTQDDEGWTILHHLVADNDIENITLLLESFTTVLGDDTKLLSRIINHAGKQNRTAFYLSVTLDYRPIIKLLLDTAVRLFKNDPNEFVTFVNKADNRQYRTPLMVACLEDRFDVVKLIIEASVRALGCRSDMFKKVLNAQDRQGNTALTLGTRKDIEDYLRRRGAEGQYFIGA